MEINYNVTGEKRKALIQAIGELLDVKPKYLGAPSFSYELGDISVDKQGTVLFKEDTSQEDMDRILDGLLERGFECVVPDSFVIELPREGISDLAIENLKQIVEGKAELIKKALGADALEITVTEDKIGFPWFERLPAPEELSAYARFVGHLVLMAKTLQRVNTTTKTVENEKYAFRCFLLRLGFIGEEYKETRKVLLKKLSGSSAFKSGAKDKEVSE
ncbi:hypothetical protein JCM15765_02990 [Paradesulfitobacterium aromaticivorans]